jgi:hypothetical protein
MLGLRMAQVELWAPRGAQSKLWAPHRAQLKLVKQAVMKLRGA